MKKTAVFAIAAGLGAALVAPATAGNPFGVDHHANCTGGFAVGSTLGGSSGATELAVIAQPPKQFGNESDVGFYSSTDCA
jgi:hypothetical protein